MLFYTKGKKLAKLFLFSCHLFLRIKNEFLKHTHTCVQVQVHITLNKWLWSCWFLSFLNAFSTVSKLAYTELRWDLKKELTGKKESGDPSKVALNLPITSIGSEQWSTVVTVCRFFHFTFNSIFSAHVCVYELECDTWISGELGLLAVTAVSECKGYAWRSQRI